MGKILGNIVEMFIYASVYMVIAMVAMKIMAATLSPETEHRNPDGNMGLSLILAAVLIGLAVVLSTVIR